MPYDIGGDVIETRMITLQEALALSKTIPTEPTVTVDLSVTTDKNGRRYLNIPVPLDLFDDECRKKTEKLKGGKQKVKCNVSLIGMIPNDTLATITTDDGKSTIQAPLKTGQPLRVNIGMDLGNHSEVDTPAYMRRSAGTSAGTVANGGAGSSKPPTVVAAGKA